MLHNKNDQEKHKFHLKGHSQMQGKRKKKSPLLHVKRLHIVVTLNNSKLNI